MKTFVAISRKHASILMLCILFIILSLCAVYLLNWRRESSVLAEPTLLPSQTLPQRTYTSQFSETPVPTLPGPYLYTSGPSAEPTAAPTPSPAQQGLLGDKYAWRFSDEEILTDHTYSNKSISISWDMYRDTSNYSNPVTFYVADVLVQDVTSLRTAFAKDTYAVGGVTSIARIAKRNRCIVAISGDFSRWHKNGLIIRNGEVLRKIRYTSDLCVLYMNGVMETYESGTVPLEKILSMGPWQSWHFGPELLDHNGQPKTKFNTSVAGRNPRSVIGYYEPGHYCLIVVDGRQGKYSGGLSMKELSRLAYSLGCIRAYNLDGGATAHMAWTTKLINSPSSGRNIHDVICVCFPSDT